MSLAVLYSGPGNVVLSQQGSTYAISAEGENGVVEVQYVEKRTRRSTGTWGYKTSTLDDQMVKITTTPFDSWALLPALYPPYLGINTAASTATGKQLIGMRPHDWAGGSAGAPTANATAPTTIYGLDGRLITVGRTAIVKHPGLKLGVGMPLFTGMEIAGLVPVANSIGSTSALLTMSNDPQDSGGSAGSNNFVSSTTPAYGVPDFINGHWTGALGSLTGFTNLDPEDGWEINVDAKYSALTVQKRTVHYKLDGVEITAKARLTGPSATQLNAYILAHTLGGELTGTPDNLVLTGPSSKTITLFDCEMFFEGGGQTFGSTKLSFGDVMFVTRLDFTAGATKPVMTFSS